MPDFPFYLVLHGTVFCAALLQAVTGIGFALIAGPVLLIAMGDSRAFQVSIVLNLVMALLMTPFLYRHCSVPHLRRLLIGTAIGLPLGVILFGWVDLAALKTFTGLLLLLVLLQLAVTSRYPSRFRYAIGGKSAGVISGVMTGFAAMPGPVASAYLLSSGDLDPRAIRATIFAMFLGSYSAALLVHWSTGHLQVTTFSMAMVLLPATLLGIAAGSALAPHVHRSTFVGLVLAALAITASLLLLG